MLAPLCTVSQSPKFRASSPFTGPEVLYGRISSRFSFYHIEHLLSCLYNNNNWLALNRVNYLWFLDVTFDITPFHYWFCNIMMKSTCSVVYLSPLHTSFMQVFLASWHCYQFSWTGHQRVTRNSFTRKGKVLIHFQAWKRSESLSSSFYQRTEYFFLERNSTFSENTPSKNEILKKKKPFRKYTFRKYTF